MKKSAKGEGGKKAARGQLWLHLPGMVRDALYDTVIGAGLACVEEVLEMERVALCGERYARLAERQALRAGHVASSLVLGGRRVAMQRPRARSVAGGELRLPSWREWSARDPLDERALEQMVLGVSTRGYARSLEPLPEAVAVRGISKSAVSERFVYGTEHKLAELMSRDLRQLHIVALLIDGVHFGEHVVLAAVGVDAHGDKRAYSALRQGYTVVSPGYLRTMGIPVVEGRDFADGIASDGELIIDEQTAVYLWPDGHWIGNQIKLGSDAWYERRR